MDWQERLITLYLWVCNQYEHALQWGCERHSFHARQRISDEEVLTVYLFGLLQQPRPVRQIHTYAQGHLTDWFPFLPSYAGFIQRLNHLTVALSLLVERLAQAFPDWDHHTALLDSMPIVLAQGPRRFQAKVAGELAGAGYCPSKKHFYHGLKLHCLAKANPGALPVPHNLALTPANVLDLKALPEVLSTWQSNNLQIFADKAFHGASDLTQGLIWHIPPKKAKGEKHLDAADKHRSTAISRTRQPIESLLQLAAGENRHPNRQQGQVNARIARPHLWPPSFSSLVGIP